MRLNQVLRSLFRMPVFTGTLALGSAQSGVSGNWLRLR